MATMRKLRPINGRPGKPAPAYELPEGEYWVKTLDGLGVRLSVSNGPAGLGVTVTRFVGTPAITVTDHYDMYVSTCQYRQDDHSQAFKRWYLEQETDADIAILGEEYRRKR